MTVVCSSFGVRKNIYWDGIVSSFANCKLINNSAIQACSHQTVRSLDRAKVFLHPVLLAGCHWQRNTSLCQCWLSPSAHQWSPVESKRLKIPRQGMGWGCPGICWIFRQSHSNCRPASGLIWVWLLHQSRAGAGIRPNRPAAATLWLLGGAVPWMQWWFCCSAKLHQCVNRC